MTEVLGLPPVGSLGKVGFFRPRHADKNPLLPLTGFAAALGCSLGLCWLVHGWVFFLLPASAGGGLLGDATGDAPLAKPRGMTANRPFRGASRSVRALLACFLKYQQNPIMGGGRLQAGIEEVSRSGTQNGRGKVGAICPHTPEDV
jgi:hypothetical protein